MSWKLPLMSVAAAVVLVAGGAQFAGAQSVQKRGSVEQTTVQETAPVQPGTVTRTDRVSRPVIGGALRPPVEPTVMALTEAECTGLGGKVVDVTYANCHSTRQCVTANDDNTVHYKCISKQ